MTKNSRVVLQVPSSGPAKFKTSVSIGKDQRSLLIGLLNERLADAVDLHSQTKFAHWNVKGRDFHQLHLLFDSIATHLAEHVDTLAERITAIGGRADGTVRQAAKNSSIEEFDFDISDGMDCVSALSQRLAEYANLNRKAIQVADERDDAATADLFTQIVREADKDLYFLEAHIQA